jgi:hypothetical protein
VISVQVSSAEVHLPRRRLFVTSTVVWASFNAPRTPPNKGIEDNAENALSGTYYGVFPTGDGRPGGDFQAWIETYHNIVKPSVPVPAGYVPPSAAIDPPVGTSASSRHTHLSRHGHVNFIHANKAARVVHRVKGRVTQADSTAEHGTHDKALEWLIHEIDGRLRRR